MMDDADALMRQRVGTRIRLARTGRGLSQAELAMRVGVGESYVSRWETGRNVPAWRFLFKLAETLEVTIGWLVEEPPDGEPVMSGDAPRPLVWGETYETGDAPPS